MTATEPHILRTFQRMDIVINIAEVDPPPVNGRCMLEMTYESLRLSIQSISEIRR